MKKHPKNDQVHKKGCFYRKTGLLERKNLQKEGANMRKLLPIEFFDGV